MKQTFWKLSVIIALAMMLGHPGMASADYIQNWTENGLYGTPPAYQAWDKAEAFLHSGNTWVGSGLTINSGTGWTTAVINPQYAVATTSGPAFDSSTQGNFSFTTHTTDLIGTFSFDWVLSNQSAIVGVYNLTWTPTGGWSGTEYAPVDAPPENRSHAPLPPTMLLLGSALVGLVLLRWKEKAAA